MKNFLLLLLFLGALETIGAQPLAGSSNYEQLVSAAEIAEGQSNWNYALDKYEEAYEKQEDEVILARIARLGYAIRDFAGAERDFRKLFRKIDAADTTYNALRFLYGRTLKMNEKYDDAIMLFQDFLRHNTDERLKTLAEREIVGAEMAQNTNMETAEVAIKTLGTKLNGSFSEYSPALAKAGDVLYFSTWDAKEVIVPEDPNDEANYSRIFMSTLADNKKGEKEWGKPEALSEEVNRPRFHTANPAISADGRRLYYNRIVLEGNVAAESALYMSDVEDTGWKSGNPVAGINGEYLVLQPAVGELFGEEVIFFVSDMPGGQGGLDIYYAPYKGDNRFGDPVNLGPTINTVGDDITPFYYDGTLYFSTDGLPTYGGKDIYYSVWNGSNWSDPAHMGPGFNTSLDDQSFRLYGDGYTGFLTSNRLGGRSVKSRTCCDDIYGFEIAKLYANLVVGLFSEDKQGLVGGNVRLIPVANGQAIGQGERQEKEKGNRFDYGLTLETDYLVVADHPKYYPDTFRFNTLALTESKTIEHRFFLKAKPVPPPPPMFDTIEIKQAIVLENILYDFDKSDIRPESEPDLEVVKGLLEEYPEMIIELGSHTDSRGVATYNRNLSKRRAESARRWLIAKGISPTRIRTEGYGMTVPQTVSDRMAARYDWLSPGQVLTDEFINSLSSEERKEAAHELNRRTEFKILEGPTSIIIRRDVLEKKQSSPDRGSQPAPKAPQAPKVAAAPTSVPTSVPKPVAAKPTATKTTAPLLSTNTDTLRISELSSLFGQKNLNGLPILDFKHRKYNLGYVKKGEKKSFSYTFTNRGTANAQVMLIQACDCTTVTHNNNKIYQPGESGTIQVVFDSTEKEEAETIGIDIFLEQEDRRGNPIVEMLEYEFKIVK